MRPPKLRGNELKKKLSCECYICYVKSLQKKFQTIGDRSDQRNFFCSSLTTPTKKFNKLKKKGKSGNKIK